MLTAISFSQHSSFEISALLIMMSIFLNFLIVSKIAAENWPFFIWWMNNNEYEDKNNLSGKQKNVVRCFHDIKRINSRKKIKIRESLISWTPLESHEVYSRTLPRELQFRIWTVLYVPFKRQITICYMIASLVDVQNKLFVTPLMNIVQD